MMYHRCPFYLENVIAEEAYMDWMQKKIECYLSSNTRIALHN